MSLMTIQKQSIATVAVRTLIDVSGMMDRHVGTLAVGFSVERSVIGQLYIPSLPSTAICHANMIFEYI